MGDSEHRELLSHKPFPNFNGWLGIRIEEMHQDRYWTAPIQPLLVSFGCQYIMPCLFQDIDLRVNCKNHPNIFKLSKLKIKSQI